MKGIIYALLVTSLSAMAGENGVITYSCSKKEMRINGESTAIDKAVALYNSNPKAAHETCIEFEADWSIFEKWNSQLVNDGPERAKGWSSKLCP
ncbi:hypothetical protein [Stutzerimonas stutzeri]|jgi:hypothetical protein|uniref:hypothetical protein n=1 Tax=Stutzerimonas stutzeri TaxID=316 RepID=UPI0012682C31|nr:hypothetical protein [Stutzerimonas stutzeri]